MQISSNMSHGYYNPFEHNKNIISTPKDENNQTEDLDKKASSSQEDKKIEQELSPKDKQQVAKLQSRDMEVRAHEAAHLAAAGGVATGGASYTYQKGPDGKQYAVGGEVPIDLSAGRTPEETISKMRKVKAAATAPASPSGADMKIASTAAMLELKAQIELNDEKSQELKPENKNPYENSKDSNEQESESLNVSA